MLKENVFGFVEDYFIIDVKTKKVVYDVGFFNRDDAIDALIALTNSHPDKEYEIYDGGYVIAN